jgi:hypothetical protein
MKAQNTWVFAVALGLSVAVSLPANAQARVDTVSYTGPDRGLLRSGAWTLGLSYVPAMIVGIGSSLPADRYLLAPVAGPWIDFAKRDCTTCEHEDLNKVLLVTDGIVQGIGALEIIGSFFFVERTTVSTQASDAEDKPKSAFELHVVPTRVAGAYGLAAIGKF